MSVYAALGETGIEGGQRKRHCLERPPEDVDENVLVESVGLWDHYRRKDEKKPLSV